MDVDKLKQWLDLAQQFQGKQFWSDIFEQDEIQNTMFNQQNQKQNQAESTKPPSALPLVDVLMNDQNIIILVDLPTIRKEDVDLTVVGDQLTIQGTARSLYTDMDHLSTERLTGAFHRIIKLPEPIIDQKVTARFYQGILEIRFNRSAPSRKNINIE